MANTRKIFEAMDRVEHAVSVLTIKLYLDNLFAASKKERDNLIPKFTNEQLKSCLEQFKGNWIKRLDNNMLLMLEDYLSRYIEKSIEWILAVPEDDESIDIHNEPGYRLSSGIRVGNRRVLGRSISTFCFTYASSVATLNCSCIIYFVNTRAALLSVHEKTLENFDTGLRDAATQSKYAYAAKRLFPPIFLAITDSNSELLNTDFAQLKIPILHSFHVSIDKEFDLDWEFLLKTHVVPCYEMLAQATGLIEKAARTIAGNTSDITCLSFTNTNVDSSSSSYNVSMNNTEAENQSNYLIRNISY